MSQKNQNGSKQNTNNFQERRQNSTECLQTVSHRAAYVHTQRPRNTTSRNLSKKNENKEVHPEMFIVAL